MPFLPTPHASLDPSRPPAGGQDPHGPGTPDGPAARTTDRLTALAAAVQGCEDLREGAGLVVEHASDVWPGARAGVVLGRGRTRALAAGDAAVAALTEAQPGPATGPHVDVLARGSETDVVVVADVAQDERWPDWAAAAAASGVRSALAARLDGPTAPLGTLVLLASEPGRFTPDHEPPARLLARHVGLPLAAVEERANLWRAAESRWLVGQAQGILMERFALDADQAFAVLRRYSQDRNTKLRTLAAQLVQTRKLPDQP